MYPKRFLAYSQAILVCLASLGCAGFPMFRSSSPETPLGAAKPGPIKHMANAISESKLGKSVSHAFSGGKKKEALKNDPTSLANGVVPTTAADYVALGDSFEQNGDGESARRMYHQALEMEPHHLGALVALGRHFDRQGQLDRAVQNYVEATQHHPSDPTAYNDLGLCLARQHRYDDGVVALKRAIQLEPDRVLYRNNVAMVLVDQNRVDEALAQLTDAHGPAIAHYNLGCLLSKRGKDDVALRHFQLALADDPSLSEAREWIESLSAEGAPDEPARMLAALPATVEVPLENAAPTRNRAPVAGPPTYRPRYSEGIASWPTEPQSSAAGGGSAQSPAPAVLPFRR